MRNYVALYAMLKPGIIKFYDTNDYDFDMNPEYLKPRKCRTHLHHLLLIEMILKNHRDKYRTSIIDLAGIKALHHMVYKKTNWIPEKIRTISINDLLFVLLEEINPESLPEAEHNYLKTILDDDNPPKIDLMSYSGWSIAEGDEFLRTYQ